MECVFGTSVVEATVHEKQTTACANKSRLARNNLGKPGRNQGKHQDQGAPNGWHYTVTTRGRLGQKPGIGTLASAERELLRWRVEPNAQQNKTKPKPNQTKPNQTKPLNCTHVHTRGTTWVGQVPVHARNRGLPGLGARREPDARQGPGPVRNLDTPGNETQRLVKT